MVICCVPHCGADSWKCDGSLTFYDFPTNPDLAAKWIKQINAAFKTRPLWFPRGKPVICSKHFIHTDFKGDTDSLKPRCVPTVFGHKYIGSNPESNEANDLNENKTTPLIVKVIKPASSFIKPPSSFIKPTSSFVKKNSNLHILNDRSDINIIHNSNNNNGGSSPEIMEIQYVDSPGSSNADETDAGDLQILSQKNDSNNSLNTSNNNTPMGAKNKSNMQQKNKTSFIKPTLVSKETVTAGNTNKQPSPVLKKLIKRKEKANNDLIEIGPNTFLKINPEIIKVNKKQTPSGNTVLQFLMNQKLAKDYPGDILPKLIQGPTSSMEGNSSSDVTTIEVQSGDNADKGAVSDHQRRGTVQHVLGHVIDTHSCEETCADLQLNDNNDDDCMIMEDSQNDTNNTSKEHNNTSNKTDASFIDRAPVLLTTNMPLSHCFVDKPKYVMQLKQKSRQISSLKFKISTLNKKIEELEDRCIVQERQLSYSFIKRLKSIRKNAAKGDPRATYILEQIRSYSITNSSKMRWSDTTLTQCAIWCRKAPYAYEYFKKADFFKLPCLGSVKRFIKKHPEIKFQKKVTNNCPQGGGGDDDDSDESSDFDFDESDGQNDQNQSDGEPVRCETILSVPSENGNSTNVKDSDSNEKNSTAESNEISKATEIISNHSPHTSEQNDGNDGTNIEKASSNSKNTQSHAIPITVDSSNLELQEIILPSGEVVQCYSSTIGSGADIGGGQYYIIPNVGEQGASGDHEYNVIQADSLPVVFQNLESSQVHHLQQDQLIFIANNATGQVECSETEVTSA